MSPNDELFVLSDEKLRENKESDQATRQFVDSQKLLKNEEKKTQENNVSRLKDMHKQLGDLLFATKEWANDVQQSKTFIQKNFSLKLRSDLEGFDNFT